MTKRMIQVLVLSFSAALLGGCLSINVDKKEVEKNSALSAPATGVTAAAR